MRERALVFLVLVWFRIVVSGSYLLSLYNIINTSQRRNPEKKSQKLSPRLEGFGRRSIGPISITTRPRHESGKGSGSRGCIGRRGSKRDGMTFGL
ncbi:hypothetical protein QBC39DRAFT_363653 [Podospora conica]|nr:hypothetical protein QBC39DRAFT_363653 [Schizothecium conicum]